jgi:REP element-mobilizing transposase RayT
MGEPRRHYHFVFIPKYRKPVLRGEIGTEVRDLIWEICRTLDIEILQGHIRPDHVHLLLSVPPHPAGLQSTSVDRRSLAFRRGFSPPARTL